MIENCKTFLKLDNEDIMMLKHLWRKLSNYQHFSYQYLEAITNDPDFCFVEKFNDDLFNLAVTYYFQTLDFFYAVLCWRLPFLRKEIRDMCKWWLDNFNKKLSITEKVLENVN